MGVLNEEYIYNDDDDGDEEDHFWVKSFKLLDDFYKLILYIN